MKTTRLALMAAAAIAAGGAHALTIDYADFSDVSRLQLNGSTAALANGVTDDRGRRVLRLTDDLWQSGSAFLANPVALNDEASFSTFFTFRISQPIGGFDGDGQGADGLVFVVQTEASSAGGVGGGIGYTGIARSVGVEFDTWDNGLGLNDPNGNHVGIDVGGAFNGDTAEVATRMNDGQDWYAWVDYDGTRDLLEVRLAQSLSRPGAATLSRHVDLVDVLGQPDAFIGFTSGTGSAGGRHDIVDWQFRDDYAPITPVPEPAAAWLFAGGLVLLGLRARRVRAPR